MSQSKRLPGRVEKADKADKDRRRFKCATCDKSFKRSEHCARHELMHTQERPFTCRYCTKRYGRKDLLKRHERNIHVDAYTDERVQNVPCQSPASASTGSSVSELDNANNQQHPTAPDREMPGSPQSKANRDDQDSIQREGFEVNVSSSLSPSFMQGTSLFDARQIAGSSLLHLGEADTPHSSDSLFFQTQTGGTPGSPANAFSIERPIGEGLDAPDRFQIYPSTYQEQHHETSRRTRSGSRPASNLARQEGATVDQDAAIWSDTAAGAVLDNLDLNTLNLQMDLGHSPVDVWSKNPDNLTLNLPVILQEQPVPSLKNIIDAVGFEWLHNDASVRLGLSGPRLFYVNELQEFTNSYIISFHQHLPFIHLPSFSPVNKFNTPSPLAFAMASIGALYRLKRRRAHEFYELTEKMIYSPSYLASYVPSRSPLWLLQTKILLAYFAVFSNKESLASEMFNRMGFMMLEYQWRRIGLQSQASDRKGMSWKEWVNYETTKRTLCAMFIFSNLMLTTFNMTPGFVIDRDLIIEMPDHEELWAAESEDTWTTLRQTLINNPQHTIHSILECMIQPPATEQITRESYRMSGFTALVVMHAVNVYLWHLNQLAQSVSRFSVGIWPHENLRGALLHAATSMLERCEAALQAGRGKDYGPAWGEPEYLPIFNCEAFLRVAYSRLLPPSHAFNRLALLTDDRGVVTRAVKTYTNERLERNIFVTKAARKAYEGFLAPVMIGGLLVSKTAAFSWSVEQAVAGWDSALLLTKWISTLEVDGAEQPPDSDELQIVDDVKVLLDELDLDSDEDSQNTSLAGMLARSWASFLDDVWVWGITPRMGAVLRLLAVEYQEQMECAH
ncbi:uncharacterized protein TRUGW13939_00902 [Talaromyces rugulosus]|uniref:C2H2-type domain-containing protein n=1 Tax=Talaromyces rugulosus TaxID=121627 RepID=A0A7H8QJJ7_TALRU|nr:uncharacterized protein TRUGW13939_00902 [Talaromyces rugulosus]QKX53822.1 hypothetical protein TRUGW13939_00902 [Talaromyces rugulosus]